MSIKSKTIIEAIDLFCGAGGLTCGLNKTGKIQVVCGLDADPKCEYPFVRNNKTKFIHKEIEKTTPKEIVPFFSKDAIRVLAGCAPCQTFSKYNPKANSDDTRWNLLLEFSRLVKAIKPEFVTMENVPGLVKQDVFHHFTSTLEKAKYKIWWDIIDCSQYGLPQQRRRLVLLASRLGKISLLPPGKCNSVSTSVRNAIGHLPRIEAGEICSTDDLHRARNLSPINLNRIKKSSPGRTWRDWPKKLIAECHKRSAGKTYPSVYGRMAWDSPSPTITTQFFGYGNGRFGHPEQDRAISLREGAILQGFPDDYEFSAPDEPISFETIGRLIGNAVPVKLGEIIGISLLHHYKNHLRN